MSERMDESRVILEKAFYSALGAYIEQESKKLDVWRDQTYGQLYNHLKHEIQEIQRSKSLTKQMHNCMDAVMLSIMLLTKVMDKSGLIKGEQENHTSDHEENELCIHCKTRPAHSTWRCCYDTECVGKELEEYQKLRKKNE